MKTHNRKTNNNRINKKNIRSTLSVTFICLCILMGSILTGCSDDLTTSADDSAITETVGNTADAEAGNTEDTVSEGTENADGSADTEDVADLSSKEDKATDDSADVASRLDENLTYYADIEIADYGTITVQLDQKSAPVTVANFVGLAESGFYDGLTFHRIMKDFMMQGGDPYGNGTGGSDQTIVGEFAINGYDNNLSHTRGAISMARSMDYDSASSQFFIVHADSTFLDGQYAAFGYVTEGLEVVDAVCESAQPVDDNGTIEAEEQPVITSITIRSE